MKILIVDDHVVVREGVRRLLSTMADVEVVEAGNARDALTEFRKCQPAIVVLDINMDASSGLEFLQRLRAISKTAKVIMFTMHSEPGYVSRAMRAGAMGYVSKSAPADELLEAVKRVSAGETYIDRELAGAIGPEQAAGADPYDNLTNREVEILRLLGEGKSIAEMAATFGVAYKTVANSCSLLKVKLGLARTADLIRLSLERRDR